MDTQFENDSNKYNKFYAVRSIAIDILRNGPSLMTMVEAIAEAEKVYQQEQEKDSTS